MACDERLCGERSMSATPHIFRRPPLSDSPATASRFGAARWALAAAVGAASLGVLALALSPGGARHDEVAHAQATTDSIDRAPTFDAPSASLSEREAAVRHPGAAASVADGEAPPEKAPRDPDRAKWRESDFYSELCEIESPAAFDAAVASALAADRPAAERFAALRASYDLRGAGSEPYFLRAAVELDGAGDAGSVSTARAAVHWLGERAAREPIALGLLERLSLAAGVDAELRAASVCTLVLQAPESELDRLEQRFSRDREERVAASAASALESRRRMTDPHAKALQEP